MSELTTQELLDRFMPSINQGKSQEEIEAWEEKRKKEEWLQKQSSCGMDSDYYGATIKNLDEKQRKIVEEYIKGVKNGKGDFLIILGDVGLGKTYSACAIINELQIGTYLDMPELSLKVNTADRFNSPINREMLLHDLAKKRLLILDEIGRYDHKKIEEQDILFYILNKRYANRRPTILCSNLNKQEFANYLGTALTDRLRGRNTTLILEGESKRG